MIRKQKWEQKLGLQVNQRGRQVSERHGVNKTVTGSSEVMIGAWEFKGLLVGPNKVGGLATNGCET